MAKRPFKNSEAGESSKKKKKKTTNVEEKHGKEEDEKKKQVLFQRIFTEEDHIALLQGILDFTSEKGEDPFKEKAEFYNFVKKSISFDASKSQIEEKVRKMKTKFEKAVERSCARGKGGEKEIVYSKASDQKAFDLWRQIWGKEGVWASKSKKKLGGKQEAAKSASTSDGEMIVAFLKAENVTTFALDEATMLEAWNMIRNGPWKRKMVEKLKKLKAMHSQLCLERVQCVDGIIHKMFKEDSSSSNGNAETLSQNEKEAESEKETDDGSKNGEVSKAIDQEDKDVSVEQLETDEGKLVEVSADELKEGDQDLEMQENEVDVVSDDTTNIEKDNEAAVIENREESRANPSVARKKLLVLDLNGLLAEIVSPRAGQKPDISIGRRGIFKRPFLEEFLNFCFENFEVAVWSSRNPNNVERISEFLLGDLKSKLLFCWDMSHCARTNSGCLENQNKVIVFKELSIIWKRYGDFDETNTVLLDDSPYKALLNPPYTSIFPHSYTHQNKTTDKSLGIGGELRAYLEKMVQSANVQEFIMKNPFGQEAISEASEDWMFYKGAISEYKNAF
ncbi:unnamed protein product [Microthlaspi erraticum]|uniref:Mitochondrial import inner membrane translocase subunit TIM50 n=1 Tax=Microthlaspi erraticum TaxID=1685480 RepID=A0A6D2JJX4_9BRAS|nr:unnamed protein product [Microthlaspi erraticum]